MIYKRLSRKVVYQSNWVDLYLDEVQDTKTLSVINDYHYLHYKHSSVAIIVENEKDEILCIYAKRYISNSLQLEIPCGKIELNETIQQAAIREVEEETGYIPSGLSELFCFNPSNGMSDELIHVLYTNTCIQNSKSIDINEVENVIWINKHELINLLFQNKITDGVSLVSLQHYLIKKYISNHDFE